MKLELGRRIGLQRRARQMTQEQLAVQLHVTRQTISKWERDQSYPDVEMVVALCQIFDVTADYLLGMTVQPQQKRPLLRVIFGRGKTDPVVERLMISELLREYRVTTMKQDEEELRNQAAELIHSLYNTLIERPNPNEQLVNITDVLLQAYKLLETANDVPVLVNRVCNYIYSVGFDGRLRLNREEEAKLIELGNISKLAGFNGQNRAYYGDKSQFYPGWARTK